MTGGPLKLARSLQPGDRVLGNLRNRVAAEMTVLAVREVAQVTERRVCLVTLRMEDGSPVERRFYPNTSVRLVIDSPLEKEPL